MKRLILLLSCLLLCACAQEDSYDPQYYTKEETGSATVIQPETPPADTEEAAGADEEQLKKTVKEYAQLLYPDNKATKIETRNRTVDGLVYVFAEAYHRDKLFCTIAYQAENGLYYLYDSEVNQLIPIEYDQDGIRLVG